MLSPINLELFFEQIKGLKVLIVGDVMIDSYLWGKADRISPEAPVPVVQVKKAEKRLGGAANVALNIKALGAEPILLSLCGTDSEGDQLLLLMQDLGMSIEGMVRSELRPTTIKHRILSGNQHLLRVDSESDREAFPSEKEALETLALSLIEKAEVVIFEDYDKGTLYPALIQLIIKHAIAKEIPTVVDPKKRNFLAYEGVDLFKPNLKELKEGIQLEVDPTYLPSLRAATSLLMDKINAKGVLLTLSEHGVYLKTTTYEGCFPAHKREISDVSGAGDTVISVAALSMAKKLPLDWVACLSNLSGGIVCEYPGVVPIPSKRLYEEALKMQSS